MTQKGAPWMDPSSRRSVGMIGVVVVVVVFWSMIGREERCENSLFVFFFCFFCLFFFFSSEKKGGTHSLANAPFLFFFAEIVSRRF